MAGRCLQYEHVWIGPEGILVTSIRKVNPWIRSKFMRAHTTSRAMTRPLCPVADDHRLGAWLALSVTTGFPRKRSASLAAQRSRDPVRVSAYMDSVGATEPDGLVRPL